MGRAQSATFDVRDLPQTRPEQVERPELEEPEPNPVLLPGGPTTSAPIGVPGPTAPAPAPIANFNGLDFATWGAGHPPDTNGDVGPTYYIQTINTSIGIYNKSGAQVAAFTFNTFMSQGHFGNLCDTNNFGDPVVLYDSFEDRWVITDFAFQIDGGGNIINPPGEFQCFAVSKSGDPVSGGWNFYSVKIAGGLGDYPKFGIWTDGIYMSANVFGYAAGASFQNPRVYAFNKAQMYAGAPTVQILSFNAPAADFTLLPSNARLQTGTPPPGTPAYFVSTWQFLNALSVYKFHVDWQHISLSTFTGPDTPLAATSWPNASVANAASLGGNSLDVLQIRAMMQNQYTNFGGVESLWTTHTVRRQNTTGFAAPRWYQVDVTGGTVAANLPQATTWDPDGANVTNRFAPSLAIDRAGDMALGYSTSDSTTKPAIKYAGRLAGDPVNTFSQTEQLLMQGTGTQTGNCGTSTCIRWGDYSAMTLDPDGCTFWYTNEYYSVDGLAFLTRVGSFSYPSCTPVGAGGTVTGTVTQGASGPPLTGATVTLGSRTTTTDGSGNYSFSVPAGTYPSMTATFPGCSPASATSIAVTDGNATTQNFALSTAPSGACLTDTSQTDFQAGVPNNVDLNASPGDVVLAKPSLDQQNTTLGNSGVGITTTTWAGQTFTPSVTGLLTKVDINLFCSGCTGTTPNLTLSVRATSGGLPTGADLATATVTGFGSGSAVFYTATFGSPATLTAGTQYALVIRPTVNPSPGTYALTRSGTSTAGSDVYPGGTRVAGATSGTVWSIPLTGGVSTDAGFRTYMDSGFGASGDFISSIKDANPASGYAATWSTLSWTASTPANTSLKFQVAASNSVFGPFNFVGPDGTPATFYTTSGGDLSQFNTYQYLEYRAYLATSDSTQTPTLNDVTVCFQDNCIPPSTPTISAESATEFCAGGSVALDSSVSPNGYQWSLNGNPISNATGQQYIATAAGDYTDTVTNNLGCTSAASSPITVTVDQPPATPTISADTNGTGTQDQACPEVPLTLNANGATGATSYQWYQDNNLINGANGQTYQATGAGTYYVSASSANACLTPQSAGYIVQNPTPHSPFVSFRNQDSSVTTLAICQGSSQIIDSDSATGIQWYKDGVAIPGANSQSYTATQAGVYTAQLDALGCHSQFGRNVTITVDSMPSTPTVTGETNGTGTQDQACPEQPLTLDASSTGAQSYTWYSDNAPFPNESTSQLVVTAVGNISVTATNGSCTTPRSATYVVQNPTPHSPFISFRNQNSSVTSLPIAQGATQIIDSDSATGIQWYKDSVAIPGAGNQSYTASQGGIYTAQLNALGCHSQFGRDVSLSSIGLTMTDNRTNTETGESVNYIIEVSNPSGSGTLNPTITDALPSGAVNGNWTCIAFGGAACASGVGNTLSDTATLPGGGEVAYVYSATVLTGNASDLFVNSANVTFGSGTPGTYASATDSDLVHIFIDGFEGTLLMRPTDVGTGTNYVAATLRVDANLQGTLSLVPTPVAVGRDANGKQLFTLELARFDKDIVLRAVTKDAKGLDQRSDWQTVNLDQHLLNFAWQTTSPSSSGYLKVGNQSAPSLLGAGAASNVLTQLWVVVQNSVPWLVVVTN
ncbi:MAG TPA: carboxypeptidase regulatory-like domain-containing protein [Rudaea sp.]|nr:carboxypeptidase regulatory-like domain-containing protein [Rudaea sp.]